MSDGNSTLARLARPYAERAILRLAAIVENGHQPPAARVAAARTLLELAGARLARPPYPPRVEPAVAAPRVVRVDWGGSD